MYGLRFKLLICLSSLLLILVAVTILANSVLSNYSSRIQQLFRNDWESAVACQSMKEAIENIDLLVQRRVWGDSGAEFVQVKSLSDEFDRQLSVQNAKADLEGEAHSTQQLNDLWQRYRVNLPYIFSVDHSDQERRNSYLLTLLPVSKNVRDMAQSLVEMNMKDMVSGHGKAKQMASTAKVTMHTLTVAGGCLALVIVGLSGTVVLQPLRELTRSVREIAGGNLDLSVPVRADDEVGKLAVAFNDMAAQLRVFKRIDHEKLLRVQHTTQLAINSLPDAVVVIDLNGRIELTNDIAKRLFLLDPNLNVTELPTRLLADLHKQAMTEKGPQHRAGYENVITVKDGGEEHHFLPKTFPIVEEDQNLIGGLVVLSDVTDLRHLDDMKNKLLAMVSHELKTPLTSMRMIMHLLSEGKIGTLTAKQQDLLCAARDDSDRLHQIVENLMDMGRIESGKALMEIRPNDSGELVARAVEAARSSFAAKNIQLSLEAPDECPLVQADADRIGHVLNNLLNNAAKYTPENGQVTLSLEEQPNGWVMFAVADNGVGIARQHVARVFEKFFRVPGQSGDSGTGLGLAIVKDIVEAHQGRVWVESREGQGTTFRFVLPRSAIAAKEIHHDTNAHLLG